MGKDVWDAVQSAPNTAARKWLTTKAAAVVLDTKQATTSDVGGRSIQVIAFISLKCMTTALKASGLDGVFVRPFMSKESVDPYKVVPLPSAVSLEEAQSKAKFLGELAFGIVSMRKGFGIRVQVADFDKAAQAVRPHDAASVIGKMFHVSGLPLACGKEALLAFLHDWKMMPVYTFVQGRTRTWAVRAEAAPFDKMFQHADGVAMVKEAPPRPPQPRKITRWAPVDGSKQPVTLPATWAEVGQASSKKQSGSVAEQPSRKPMFTRGVDLSIKEVNATQQRSPVEAPPTSQAESVVAAAVGKTDQLLASLGRLERRVDGITSDIAELRGDGISGDAMLTDEVGGRDPEQRRKTLRIS